MDSAATASVPRSFQFIRAGTGTTSLLDWGKGEEQVRKAVGEALNARHVAFLLGAGCSSLVCEGKERGIPTMAPLAKEFCSHPTIYLDDNLEPYAPPAWAMQAEDIDYLARLGAKLDGTEYSRNLERLMELL